MVSLSARRAWIEIFCVKLLLQLMRVALRKESVDRNMLFLLFRLVVGVALRKESVDRNVDPDKDTLTDDVVALRKESVDRNFSCWLLA